MGAQSAIARKTKSEKKTLISKNWTGNVTPKEQKVIIRKLLIPYWSDEKKRKLRKVRKKRSRFSLKKTPHLSLEHYEYTQIVKETHAL